MIAVAIRSNLWCARAGFLSVFSAQWSFPYFNAYIFSTPCIIFSTNVLHLASVCNCMGLKILDSLLFSKIDRHRLSL
jgi:hypothetical protein